MSTINIKHSIQCIARVRYEKSDKTEIRCFIHRWTRPRTVTCEIKAFKVTELTTGMNYPVDCLHHVHSCAIELKWFTCTCIVCRDGVNSRIGIGIVHKSIPIPELELELELFMSKLGGIGIGFGIVHLGIGIGIGHFGIGIAHLGIGIDHAQCAIS